MCTNLPDTLGRISPTGREHLRGGVSTLSYRTIWKEELSTSYKRTLKSEKSGRRAKQGRPRLSVSGGHTYRASTAGGLPVETSDRILPSHVSYPPSVGACVATILRTIPNTGPLRTFEHFNLYGGGIVIRTHYEPRNQVSPPCLHTIFWF